VRPGDLVRLARREEIASLGEIESRAGERFRSVGLSLLADRASLPVERLAMHLEQGCLWVAVADDAVIGYAAAGELEGRAWLHRVVVVPEHGERGVGRLLIDEALLWALRAGRDELALATWTDLPWNRAFDHRRGFTTNAATSADLEALRSYEQDLSVHTDRVLVSTRSLRAETLAPWGWNEWFQRQSDSDAIRSSTGVEPARVMLESRGIHEVITAAGPLEARIAGRLKRDKRDAIQPAIGDWVLLRLPERRAEHGLIETVLERRSKFSRKVAGARTEEQVVAANVDRVFVVMGLDGDFNLRRLERFLITSHRSGAEPVVVLNKSDLAPDLETQIADVRRIAGAVPVHVAAAKLEAGLDELRVYLVPGETIALVGSSGVGKSTLLNRLYGETIMRTRKVREADDRGRHTTTHRQIVRLPNGSLLIDNPGIRELQLWDSEEGIEEAFADIEELAAGCRFRDCEHVAEPGCAVIDAAQSGTLESARLASYRSYVDELQALGRRQDEAARLPEKQRWKAIHKALRKHKPRG
jgi:ribosome biogenesis GTPase / thiamine phosphate phosphatase